MLGFQDLIVEVGRGRNVGVRQMEYTSTPEGSGRHPVPHANRALVGEPCLPCPANLMGDGLWISVASSSRWPLGSVACVLSLPLAAVRIYGQERA